MSICFTTDTKVADMLRNQAGFKASGTIKQIQKEKKKNRNYNIVGIVLVTKNQGGGKMVTIEDMSSTIVFVRKDDPACATIFKDEVLGISGRFGDDGNVLGGQGGSPRFASELSKQSGEDDPVSIAFISDSTCSKDLGKRMG